MSGSERELGRMAMAVERQQSVAMRREKQLETQGRRTELHGLLMVSWD